MRRRAQISIAVLTLASVLAAAGLAQTPESEDAPAVENPTIEDLAWIAGTWSTDLADQVLEERWSPPMANAMAGSFRWARDGEVWLYEFLLIEETADGIFYYLRHFGPGSLGWEERDAPLAYRLDSLAPNRAEFASVDDADDSFVFSREGDELTIEIVSAQDSKRFVYGLQAEPGATDPNEVDSPEQGAEGTANDGVGADDSAVDPAAGEDTQPAADTATE